MSYSAWKSCSSKKGLRNSQFEYSSAKCQLYIELLQLFYLFVSNSPLLTISLCFIPFFIFSSHFGKKSFDRIRRRHLIRVSHLPRRKLKLLNWEASSILCHFAWCHYLGNIDYRKQTNKTQKMELFHPLPITCSSQIQRISWVVQHWVEVLNAGSYASAVVSVNLPAFACSHEVNPRAQPFSSPSSPNENHVLL